MRPAVHEQVDVSSAFPAVRLVRVGIQRVDNVCGSVYVSRINRGSKGSDMYESNGFNVLEDGLGQFGVWSSYHGRACFMGLTEAQAREAVGELAKSTDEDEYQWHWWTLAQRFGYWMTLAQAGSELGVSGSTLRNQINRGRLRGTLVGKTWLVYRPEIERYRAESLGKPGRHAAAS
jgi:excisionase family DNA binding protein